jgi:hypothetical protein
METKKVLLIFSTIVVALTSCSLTVKQGNWEKLFNGIDLSEWKSSQIDAFGVADSAIVSSNAPAVIYYTGELKEADFRNFELKADMKTSPDARATLIFHTTETESTDAQGYAVQVMNSDAAESDFRKTGSLLGIRDVYKSLTKDEEWFNLHIVVKGKRVLIYVNDIQTVDYTEPENVNREPHLAQRRLSSGTFALQTNGVVSIKNILVKSISDKDTLEAGKEYFTPEKQEIVDVLIGRGYPMIDYHIHMKGEVTLDDILDKSRRTGIFCSVAPNCGVGFPIDTNEKLEEFYNEYKDVPIFLSMQAEGREWVTTFEKESIAKYDYVFTDAMTFSDRKGNRMQIWKDEQVNITDPQDFMELLVETIEDVLDHEKIDIYANATFLPTVIADQYNALWTEKRMDRVVDALARNDIALEISARYRIPGPALIKKAKAKGVKFTFGTNNSDHDFANLDYCLEMIDECGLQPTDFFLPRAHGNKPVQVKL